MRIELRDAEWRIDRVDVPSHGGHLLTCTGHSELVRGKTGTFLTELESGTRILTPETTELTDDLSRGYAATQLKLHALSRRQIHEYIWGIRRPLTPCRTSWSRRYRLWSKPDRAS